MTDDDLTKLSELGRSLPAADLDATAAERIARHARGSVGKGPPPTRFVEPALAFLATGGYLAYAIVKILEALG